MLTVAGYWADIISIGITSIQHRYLGQPAVYPAITAIGAEHNTPIRKVSRFDVIILAESKLLQISSVDIDFIEIKVFRAGFSIRKYDLFVVVVYLWVAYCTFRVVQ